MILTWLLYLGFGFSHDIITLLMHYAYTNFKNEFILIECEYDHSLVIW